MALIYNKNTMMADNGGGTKKPVTQPSNYTSAGAAGALRPTGVVGNGTASANAATLANQTPGYASNKTSTKVPATPPTTGGSGGSGGSGSSKASGASTANYNAYLSGLGSGYNAQAAQLANQLALNQQTAKDNYNALLKEYESNLAAGKQQAQQGYDTQMGMYKDQYAQGGNLLLDQYNAMVEQIKAQNAASKAQLEALYGGQGEQLIANKDAMNALYAEAAARAQEAQKQAYEYNLGQMNQQAVEDRRSNYVNMMQNQRRMNQLLSAQGIGGGAAESTQAKTLNAYLGEQAAVGRALANNQNALAQAYQQQLAQIEQERLAGEAGALADYQNASGNLGSAYMAALQQQLATGDSNLNAALGNYQTGQQNLWSDYTGNQNAAQEAYNNAVLQLIMQDGNNRTQALDSYNNLLLSLQTGNQQQVNAAYAAYLDAMQKAQLAML